MLNTSNLTFFLKKQCFFKIGERDNRGNTRRVGVTPFMGVWLELDKGASRAALSPPPSRNPEWEMGRK